MIGPLRFVNHLCQSANSEVRFCVFTFIKLLLSYAFNLKWVAIAGTHAFMLCTKKDVKEGEELFIDYGSDYFGDICPCATCVEHLPS
jgi:hypothetical protein